MKKKETHSLVGAKLESDLWGVSMNAYAQLATLIVRSLIIINGGAIVVLMALLGNLATPDGDVVATAELAQGLQWPLGFFILGIGNAIFGALFFMLPPYLSLLNPKLDYRLAKNIWVYIGTGIITVLVSLTAFAVGAWFAIDTFSVA